MFASAYSEFSKMPLVRRNVAICRARVWRFGKRSCREGGSGMASSGGWISSQSASVRSSIMSILQWMLKLCRLGRCRKASVQYCLGGQGLPNISNTNDFTPRTGRVRQKTGKRLEDNPLTQKRASEGRLHPGSGQSSSVSSLASSSCSEVRASVHSLIMFT